MRARAAIGRMLASSWGPVHVREDGAPDAPVVLLLHGFASSMHSFDRLAALLAADHLVVRVDLLGHGCSPAASSYDSESQAAMVGAAMADLGLRPDTVVGHSFGADVAIAVAEQARDARVGRVGRVVVVGQAPDYASARLPRGSALVSRPVVARWLVRLAPAAAINRSARFAFAPGARADLLFDHPGRRALDARATAPAMYRTVLVDRPALLARRGLDDRLRDLGRPALVILGALDQIYPAGPARARYARVPGLRVEVLPGSGHSPVLEQPEETARLIREFVAGPGAAPSPA